MTGLKFPKTKAKKKRKRHAPSIIQERDGTCFLCRQQDNWRQQYVHKHHIFGGPDRDKSEAYGLTVYLCVEHHEIGPDAVHRNAETRKYLQRIGQQAFDEHYGPGKFVEIFYKNYL